MAALFGDWSKGDIFADNGLLGGIKDNKRSANYSGVKWLGQDGKTYYKDWQGGVSTSPQRNTNYNTIADPNAGNGGGSNPAQEQVVGGGGGVVGGGGYDYYAAAQAAAQAKAEEQAKANSIAAYDEAIRTAQAGMGRLSEQERAGLDNVTSWYNEQRGSNDTGFNRSKGQYDMNTADTVANNRSTRNQIQENARNQTRGLQQMFAAGGAGDSSWSKVVAPFEVGKAATRQAGDVQDAYAKNRRDLDINFNAVKNAYEDNNKKLEREKGNRINSVRSSVLQAMNDLEQKIREANIGKSTATGASLADAQNATRSAQDVINQRNSEIDKLSRNISVPLSSTEWKAPTLDSYADKATGVAIENGDGDGAGLQDQLDPNLQALLDPEKKKRETQLF